MKLCSCCGVREATESHHLIPRSLGGPDDLTVRLCGVCHGRTHGICRPINHPDLVREGLRKAKNRGVALGNPLHRSIKLTDRVRAWQKDNPAQYERMRKTTSERTHSKILIRALLRAEENEHVTIRALADAMTELGIPTPRGRATWDSSTVLRVLRRDL